MNSWYLQSKVHITLTPWGMSPSEKVYQNQKFLIASTNIYINNSIMARQLNFSCILPLTPRSDFKTCNVFLHHSSVIQQKGNESTQTYHMEVIFLI